MMQAYSQLKSILEQLDVTLTELRQLLQRCRVRVGQRSLSRLTDESRPLERLDMRLASAICEACEVSLSKLIVFRSQDNSFHHISLVKQKRLDYLMDGNNDGCLSEAELAELRQMVRECEEMTLRNAQFLAEQHQAASV